MEELDENPYESRFDEPLSASPRDAVEKFSAPSLALQLLIGLSLLTLIAGVFMTLHAVSEKFLDTAIEGQARGVLGTCAATVGVVSAIALYIVDRLRGGE